MLPYINIIYWYGFILAWVIHLILYAAYSEDKPGTLFILFGLCYASIWPILPLYYIVIGLYALYRKSIGRKFNDQE
jgi:hypothetical protein